VRADFPREREVMSALIRNGKTGRAGFTEPRIRRRKGGGVIRKTAYAVALVLLFATTALADGKITVKDQNGKDQTIEFVQKPDKAWVVKNNGREDNVVEVGGWALFQAKENGTLVPKDTMKDVFIVYQGNSTCYVYWNGSTYVKKCY
jgi:hypothetical protein